MSRDTTPAPGIAGARGAGEGSARARSRLAALLGVETDEAEGLVRIV